jgi:hypothetical protein
MYGEVEVLLHHSKPRHYTELRGQLKDMAALTTVHESGFRKPVWALWSTQVTSVLTPESGTLVPGLSNPT